MPEAEAISLACPELAGTTVYRAGGCRYCAGTGFMGRIGLFEFIVYDQEMARVVASRPDETHIQQLLNERQLPDLMDDSVAKLTQGLTSVQQIATVISPY